MAIGGSLDFGSMSGGAGLLQGYGNLSALSNNYARTYNSALALNQQNYNNVLGGYQQTQNALQSGYAGFGGGYSDLMGSALGYMGGGSPIAAGAGGTGGARYAANPQAAANNAANTQNQQNFNSAYAALARGDVLNDTALNWLAGGGGQYGINGQDDARRVANGVRAFIAQQQGSQLNDTARQWIADAGGEQRLRDILTYGQRAGMTNYSLGTGLTPQQVAQGQAVSQNPSAEVRQSLANQAYNSPGAFQQMQADRQARREAGWAEQAQAAGSPGQQGSGTNPWTNYVTGGVGANGVVGSGSVGPAGAAGGGIDLGGGYAGLNAGVVNALRGIGAAKEQEINDQYSALMGQQTQRLIDSGITNSTVLQSVARGIDLDRQKASIANSNQVSGQVADYMSRIGLAGLDQANQNRRFDIDQSNTMNRFGRQLTEGARQFDVGQANTMSRARAELAAQIGLAGLSARERGLNAVATQGNRQLDWMNSVNIPYPDAGAYTQLAAQYGQVQQQNFDRLLAAQQAQQDREAAVKASQIALAQANRAPAATYGGTTMGAGPSFGSGPQGYYGAAPAPALQGAGGGNPYANAGLTPMASAYLAGSTTYGGGYSGLGGLSTSNTGGRYGSEIEDLTGGYSFA